MKVLIGEDNPLSREILRSWLLEAGYSPLEAATGRDVLKTVETLRPRWLILDLHLADANGLNLCEEIRELFPGITIIAVSATTPDDIDRQCQALGIARFFQKPLKRQALIEALGGAIHTEKTLSLPQLREKILNNVDGNAALFDRVIELFLEQSPGFMQQIENACREKNPAELERWAHKLKGYTGYISVDNPLYQGVTQLESAGRRKDLTSVDTLLPRVREAYQSLTGELRSLERS